MESERDRVMRTVSIKVFFSPSGGYKYEAAEAAQQGCLPQHHSQGGSALETSADSGQ